MFTSRRASVLTKSLRLNCCPRTEPLRDFSATARKVTVCSTPLASIILNSLSLNSESKFAAIDKGITGVQDWKTNIDKQRLELKQNTAKQIREAEKYAFENMPNDETAKARILKDLAKYKDQMLMNERLVRNGAISPEENLIFFKTVSKHLKYMQIWSIILTKN